ncbi:MAG: dihydropteroate synthase [Cyclobacteriaceae bacterium]
MQRPLIMGILNTTPDSFFDGGKYIQENHIVEKVNTMLSAGVDIIDIGGYSTRPGADEISEQEEIKRVINGITIVKKLAGDIPISIDTFRSEVAHNALVAGAAMINDVSAGSLDSKMFELVADMGVPYVLMHMRGTPKNMMQKTSYDDLLHEMINYFEKKVSMLRQKGVKDIIIDPGFGFAKTIDQNYSILKHLAYFKILNLPIMAGLSRKSMIYKKLGISVENALNGTTALHVLALQGGCSILRVHDVKEASEVVKLYNLTNN